jgi:hypothetical protein
MTAIAAIWIGGLLLLTAAIIQGESLWRWRAEEITAREFLERQRAALILGASGLGIAVAVIVLDWAVAVARLFFGGNPP